jgi:ParB/RepB/Spo0J family partition protein
MRKSWKTVDVKLVKMGILPQGRSIRACRMFCRRHGIVFPGKKIIDENDELIKLLDERYSPKQTKGTEMKKETPKENLRIINVASIDENDDNPRTRIENVEDLKASIKASGLLQPIVVRSVGKRWKVVAGSRRFKACKEIGLDAIPCVVIEADDERAYELATAENIVRENMNAVDEANAVQKLFAQGKSRIEIGAMFGKSARWAEGRRRIAELGGKAMEYLAAGKINLGHAEVLTMCPAEDVEKYLNVAIYRTPEDLKNEIMSAKPLLERAPFDAKKVCKHCENRSDMQTDLFGDVQCCYCLDKECFEKQVAKKAEEIRKDYIKQGFEEVPEEDVDEAEYGYGDYIDAETDDEDEQKTIEKLKSEGVKPMFWVNVKKADHGLVYYLTRSYDEDCDGDDEQREPEDTNSWTFIINHMDWKRRDKVKKAASAEEKRIVADKIQSVFGLISKTAKAFILEICNCEYEADNGDTETYLKHQSEASCDFLEEVADSLVSEWSGVNDDIREFLEMDSREDFERRSAEAIPEDETEEPEEPENEDSTEDDSED